MKHWECYCVLMIDAMVLISSEYYSYFHCWYWRPSRQQNVGHNCRVHDGFFLDKFELVFLTLLLPTTSIPGAFVLPFIGNLHQFIRMGRKWHLGLLSLRRRLDLFTPGILLDGFYIYHFHFRSFVAYLYWRNHFSEAKVFKKWSL
jgi:hypothetical protein